MATDGKGCENCGKIATVSILYGYRSGAALIRRFCVGCADHSSNSTFARNELSGSSALAYLVLTLCATTIGLLLLIADRDLHELHPGFGVFQLAVCGAGLILALVGALSRTAIISVIGVSFFVAGLAADFLPLFTHPGFGWKKCSALVVALALLVVGVRGQRGRAAHAD